MTETLIITKEQADQIIAQAKAGAPREICGIMGGRHNKVLDIFPATNIDGSTVTYKIDPKEQFQIMRRIREQGLELVGIYHSHPATVAYPSATDCRLAFYPEAHYVIVSLEKKEPVIRAFKIVNDEIAESKLNII